MNAEFLNLLPEWRQKALVRDYFVRLSTVALALATILILIAAILLLPASLLLSRGVSSKEAQLASIQATLTSADEAALSARLAALSSDADVLLSLDDAPSASGLVNATLALSRPGITLSSFSYTPARGGAKNGSLVVSGIAATREALRTYQLTLDKAPFAASAFLPVSAYAKDTNISFAITVTLAP